MNILEIYNALFAGKKLQMPFSSEDEAEIFRVRLAQYKTRQDRLLLGLEVIAEKQVFSFTTQRSLNREDPSLGPPVVATMQFRDKDVARNYIVTIIEDDVEEAAE